MSKTSDVIARFLYKFRLGFFALALAMSVFFAFNAIKIQFNFSPDTIFLQQDEAYNFYENTYLPAFANKGQWCMLAVESKDKTKLAYLIKSLSAKLLKNEHILQVIDPFSQELFMPTEQGIKAIATTDKNGQLTPEAVEYFNNHPLYQGSFIGKDGHSMALNFMVASEFENQEEQEKVIASIENDIYHWQQDDPNVSLYLTGVPVIQYEMIQLLKSDQTRFVPFVALFLILLLFVMTKHIFGALYPLFVIFLALTWTVGYLVLAGHDINVVNNALIMLIMVIGIADAVHIYTRYIDEAIDAHQKNPNAPAKKEVVISTISAMLLPCFLTTATTALGFLSSAFTDIEIIKLFGIDTAVGVMFCYIITFMIMPALLSWHKLPTRHSPTFMRKWPKILTIDGMLRFTIGKSVRYAKLLTTLSAVFLIVSVIVGKNITSNQNWTGELPPDNKANNALKFIEKNFSAIMPFYVVFSGSEEILNSRHLALSISDMAQKIRNYPLHPTVRAPTDALNFLLAHNPPPLELSEIDDGTYGELNKIIMQFGEEKENNAAAMFFSKDRQHLRILGFLPNTSTTQAERFRKFLLKTLEEHKVEGISLHATGPALISSNALHHLTRSMASSIGLALIFISVFVAIFFRSLRYMIAAVLPNILPIGLTIAAMYIFGIDVRLATVMIFSMALGLSIDACIHLLSRMEEERHKTNRSLKKITFIRTIFRAFHGSGRPIIYTTAILLGGFSIMFFSQFMALKDFSIIATITLLSALIADIILLPALILVLRKRS
ncbi:MAG: MMPL family transporter [Myxococcales bacterium]|nr:MMPL family transporter [Myxococcales bacterium]USN51382.1 MAG: MMPL family transporter [Myxococcales bacterium]